jgi:trk system potassium uptake protein TrkH
VAFFQNRMVEAVLMVLMVIGGLTFPLMVLVFHGRPGALLRDEQTRAYLAIIAVVTLLIAGWRVAATGTEVEDALWPALFNVVSVITTTGFASADYIRWGSFPETMFLLITLIGGCTGSTSGGIKIYRILILAKTVRNQVLTRLQPHRVIRITYNERLVDDEVVRSVSTFVWSVFLALALLTAAVSASGVDTLTALSGVAQAIANVGPGVGPIVGPAGNYATMPESALWALSAAMLLGRLEVIIVLVVLSPAFWRR